MTTTKTLGEEISRVLNKYGHRKIIHNLPNLIIFEAHDGDIVAFYPTNGMICELNDNLPYITINGAAGVQVRVGRDNRGLTMETHDAIKPTTMAGSMGPMMKIINTSYIPPA